MFQRRGGRRHRRWPTWRHRPCSLQADNGATGLSPFPHYRRTSRRHCSNRPRQQRRGRHHSSSKCWRGDECRTVLRRGQPPSNYFVAKLNTTRAALSVDGNVWHPFGILFVRVKPRGVYGMGFNVNGLPGRGIAGTVLPPDPGCWVCENRFVRASVLI